MNIAQQIKRFLFANNYRVEQLNYARYVYNTLVGECYEIISNRQYKLFVSVRDDRAIIVLVDGDSVKPMYCILNEENEKHGQGS